MKKTKFAYVIIILQRGAGGQDQSIINNEEDEIMAFDFKKEYKEFYMPKNKPEIVNVPKANYIAVRGKGNPNEEGGAYQ